MTLPAEVLQVVAALRTLPQSWLADRALTAALEADMVGPEPAFDQNRQRARRLLLAIEERLDADLTLLINLPQAMDRAFAQLRGVDREAARPDLPIMWVSDGDVPHPFVAADAAVTHFREEMLRYLEAVLAGLDGPPPAPGSPANRPPEGEGPPAVDDGVDGDPDDPENGDEPPRPRFR